MRFARERVVTAAVDHVDFVAPVGLGEVATVATRVSDAGRTSVDVRVEVGAENPRTGERRETTSSFLTFVAIDDDCAPAPVPTLVCPTDAEEHARRGVGGADGTGRDGADADAGRRRVTGDIVCFGPAAHRYRVEVVERPVALSNDLGGEPARRVDRPARLVAGLDVEPPAERRRDRDRPPG